MCLIASGFLSSIISHLSTDGLEDVLLVITDENSVTRNPIWASNFSFMLARTHRLSSALLFSLAAAYKELVFTVASCWHSMESFGLMLSYYSMSGFPVLENPVNRNCPISVCHLPSFLVLITVGGALWRSSHAICLLKREPFNSAGPAFDCQ